MPAATALRPPLATATHRPLQRQAHPQALSGGVQKETFGASPRSEPVSCPLVGTRRLVASAPAGVRRRPVSGETEAAGQRSCSRGSAGTKAQSSAAAAPLLVRDSALGALLRRGEQIDVLATNVEQPCALLTAVVLDALSGSVPHRLPQVRPLRTMVERLEAAVYCPLSVTQGDSIVEGMPQQYAWRTPYFVIAEQQREKIRQMQVQVRHCQDVITRTRRLKLTQESLTAALRWGIEAPMQQQQQQHQIFPGPGPRRSNQRQQQQQHALQQQGRNQRPTIAKRSAACDATYMWVLGFWFEFVAAAKRKSTRRKVLVQRTVVDGLRVPFKHWKLYTLEQLCIVPLKMCEDLKEEQAALGDATKDLQKQLQDTCSAVTLCRGMLDRLQETHDKTVKRIDELSQLLAEANPGVVRSALGLVLTFVLRDLFKDARLSCVMAKQGLAMKELTALLFTDEECLEKLPQGEVLLLRWVNYHLSQFKLLAMEILETAVRARAENVVRAESEWSKRDADNFGDRCRVVRAISRVANLHSDLKDGAVLAVLYASIVEMGSGEATLSPARLWLLDERDIEARNIRLCNALRLVLPSRAGRCLLTHSDISGSNSNVLKQILASLFLHRSGLPSVVYESKAFEFLIAGLSEFLRDSHAGPSAGANPDLPLVKTRIPSKSSPAGVALNNEHDKATIRQAACSMERMAMTCAYESLQDLSVLCRSEPLSTLRQLQPDELLLRWVNLHVCQSPRGTIESLSELKDINVLLDLLRRVAGDVLLLHPLAKGMLAKRDVPGLSEDQLLDVIVACGNRCTAFPILTIEAVRFGQIDTLAAFVAGLFLTRPTMPVKSSSRLFLELEMVAVAVCGDARVPSQSGIELSEVCDNLRKNGWKLREALLALQTAGEVQQSIEQRMYMFQTDVLMHRAHGDPCFFGVGKGSKQHGTLVAGDGRPSAGHIMEVLRLEATKVDLDSLPDLHHQQELVEDVLRKNGSLFRDMFRHYSATSGASGSGVASSMPLTPASGGGHFRRPGRSFRSPQGFMLQRHPTEALNNNVFVDLRSFVRLHRDCRLRGAELLPADMEDIFEEITGRAASLACAAWDDHTSASGGVLVNGLGFNAFLEAMLMVGCRAWASSDTRTAHDDCCYADGGDNRSSSSRSSGGANAGFAARLVRVVDEHLWPYAMRCSNELFYQLCYDPGLTAILWRLEGILRAVFERYSRPPSRRPGKLRRGATGPMPPQSRCRTMTVTSFEDLLRDSGLLRGTLTRDAARDIIKGVQRPHPPAEASQAPESLESAAVGTAGSSSPLGGDAGSYSPLAFQEFIDALVAVVLYKAPNLFLPFAVRFEKVVLSSMLVPLVRHWEARLPDDDTFLMAIQTYLEKDETKMRTLMLDANLNPNQRADPVCVTRKQRPSLTLSRRSLTSQHLSSRQSPRHSPRMKRP